MIIYHLRILLIYLTIYELTPCCGTLLEKLIVAQLLNKFPAFHVNRRARTGPYP
jgi:hypothetical protein